MILKLFTIKDIKAETYMAPFTARTRAEAIRMFTDDVNSGKSVLAKHPADYMLICIGDFNTETGGIEGKETLDVIGLGIDFVQESLEPALPNL